VFLLEGFFIIIAHGMRCEKGAGMTLRRFVWALLVCIPALALQAQQKYALVIGNGAYTTVTRLNNPVNDATDMAGTLRGLGFQVDLLLNGSLEQMEDGAIRLKNRLSVNANAYGFFFYAGHGVQSGGNNYLIPVNADIKSESFLRSKALQMQAVLDELNEAGNALNVVVLDACRDNPFSWGRSENRGLDAVKVQPADSIVVYATQAGKTAADGTGRNSPFTTELLKNLKAPGLEVYEVFRRTGADVSRVSNREQIPAIYSQFFGVAYLGRQGVQPQPEPAPAPSAPRILPRDMAEVFGVKGGSAAFNAVHAFLQSCNSESAAGRRERIAQRIMLGDWIDLPHLTVQGDAGGGAINTDNTDLGGNGKLLRLIVVGIDSFAATNKDAPAHIVFQFQNVPGTHRMNPSDTIAGGYRASELRRYLTDSFLRGLLTAGVPEGVLYAPTRYIANGGQGASAADALRDWLWLPTERELLGKNWASNKTWETGANQARLEYYEDYNQRTKYNANGTMWWWEASPYSGSAAYFCNSYYNGATGNHLASGVGGCAPAFCVR
jgi:hypothetical protein